MLSVIFSMCASSSAADIANDRMIDIVPSTHGPWSWYVFWEQRGSSDRKLDHIADLLSNVMHCIGRNKAVCDLVRLCAQI